MKQLSSPLQQYWPTVVERLPAAISESSLSVTALLPIPNGCLSWKALHPWRMNGNTMPTGCSKHWLTLVTKTH